MKLTSFEKALAAFETALNAYHKSSFPDGSIEKEVMRDSVIQRFEFTIELSWKSLKRYLEQYGLEKVDDLNNRDLFRIGFEQGLLLDAAPWMEYLKCRNLSSHTYNVATAERVYETANKCLKDAQYLLKKLQEKAK
jgi:nucleotidyltransferase substrate binding protein (TIGR01987 family)